MGVTVGVNKRSVVHKGSDGVSLAMPDACKVQMGPAVVVLPLPNIAKSADLQKGTKKVKCDGQSVAIDGCVFLPTTGDEAGALGGVKSAKVKGQAEFVKVSRKVKFEGKGVARAFDLMMHNDKNTMVAPILQGPVAAPPAALDEGEEHEDEDEDEPCALCEKQHKRDPG